MQRSPRLSLWLRLALVPLVAAIVIAGFWVAGGVLTNDFRLSMVLTALWVGLVGLAALVVAVRWRPLALPVLGRGLHRGERDGLPALRQLRGQGRERASCGGSARAGFERDERAGHSGPHRPNVALGRGAFESAAHETTGKATLIRLAEGGKVLTLTEFETDPGPDLRVYLVTGDTGDLVDLGALKRNRGDQHYDVGRSVDTKRYQTAVIWCRAFSVAFGGARLA